MQDQFEWPEPEHEADKVILRNVRKHGCHITGIEDADPPFAFSIGLFLNYGHPELIIFGQSADNAQAIINLIRDQVAAGINSPTAISPTRCSRTATNSASCRCRSGFILSISAQRSGSTGNRGSNSRAFKWFGKMSIGVSPGRRIAHPPSGRISRC